MTRLVAVLCALLVTSACSESTSISTTTGGSFTLSTVNGNDLPAVETQSGGNRTEVLSGSVSLKTDGSWTLALTKRLTTAAGTTTNSTQTDSGTWTQNNGAVLLTSNTGAAISGTLFAGVLTLNNQGAIYLFRQ